MRMTSRMTSLMLGGLCGISTVSMGAMVYAQTKSPTSLKQQASQPNSNPVCEIIFSNGQSQDLTHLCGQSQPGNPILLIDPNTPVSVKLVTSKNPLTLWHTLPDLPTPPQAGKTEPVNPSAPTVVEPAVDGR